MGNDPISSDSTSRGEAYCDAAWKALQPRLIPGTDPKKTAFMNKCYFMAVHADSFTPEDQCFYQHADGQFVLDTNKNKVLMNQASAVTCLENNAYLYKWAPLQAANPSSSFPIMVQVGSGFNFVKSGFSVNGADPAVCYSGVNALLRVGTRLTPKQLSPRWQYHTATGLEGGVLAASACRAGIPDSSAYHIWNAGVFVSPQVSYHLFTQNETETHVVVAPDASLLLGMLRMYGPTDVGIPDRVYQAAHSRNFAQANAGIGLYLEGLNTLAGVAISVGIRAGVRWLGHEDKPHNLPPEMPADTTIKLKSPMWDTLQFLFCGRW